MLGKVLKGDGTISIPKFFHEVMSSYHKDNLLNAMTEEFPSLTESNVWELVLLPAGRTTIPVRWTYNLKVESENKVKMFKA